MKTSAIALPFTLTGVVKCNLCEYVRMFELAQPDGGALDTRAAAEDAINHFRERHPQSLQVWGEEWLAHG